MSYPVECQIWPVPNGKNKWIALGLFRGVSNAQSVREELVNGTLEAAILDCRLVSYQTVEVYVAVVCLAVH